MNRIAVILFISALVGCQKSETSKALDQPALSPTTTVVDEDTQLKAIAAREELFRRLSTRLMEVMKSTGPVAAIEVCSEEASQFAASVSEEHGVKIGRTALKLRNSKNVPPEWAKSLTSKNATETQFVAIDDNTVGALMPIKLKQNCLKCHGPLDSLAPALKEQLAKYYPDDAATGFKEGDLRGWFWVEVPKS